MVLKTALDAIPERRENWAEAEFAGGAKSILRLRSGHLLVAAFAADIPAVLNRIARELGLEIGSLRARVQIAWNPRAIAGAPGLDPVPYEAISDIWLEVKGDPAAIEDMKAAYFRRCPLYNLFRKAGCRMTDHWHLAARDAQSA
jgi:hypothetical protein